MALYEYSSYCRRVIDGDTVELVVDMGFHMSCVHHFRLIGVDTPELRGGTAESKAAARRARDRVQDLLMPDGIAQKLIIHTEKADSFGRWLAKVMFFDESVAEPHWRDLSEVLIEEGLGEPYIK
jgi:micrococcal nuclease